MEPKVLLLDEPLASLDPASAHEALQAFRQLADEGMAVMIVEHRVEDVLAIHPDLFMYMDNGQMVYLGGTDGLLNAVDYRRIKLPARVVLERARQDPAPVFIPALKSMPEAGLPARARRWCVSRACISAITKNFPRF